MAERKYAIRFSAEDMDKVRSALQGMGNDGASALRAIERQSRQATPAMKAVDTAAKDIRREFDSLADRIPVVGGMLKAIGPAGIAIGAGLAAVGAGATALWQQAQKAREELDRLATAAQNIGTSAETYQSLEALALEKDLPFERMAEAMNKLQLGAALAAKGQGELYSSLKRIKPELIEVIATAKTQEDRWDALSRAITGTESQLDKVALAKAAFGEKGAQFIRMLDGEDKTIGALTKRYRELGLVIEEDTVIAIAEMDRRLDLANKRMEIDSIRAGAAMIPVVEAISQAWNGAWISLGNYIDGLNELENRQVSTLVSQKRDLQAKREELEAFLAGDVYRVRARWVTREIEEIVRQINAIDTTLTLRSANAPKKGAVSDGTTVSDPAAEARLQAEADRMAAEAARLRAQQERDAIEVRAKLGDWTGKYAAEEARLAALVKAGALAQEDATAALKKTRAELDGSAATLDRWKAAVQATETPVERARRELAAFVAEAMTLADRGPAFQAALRYYAGALEDAEKAAREATPEFKAVAEAREKLAKAVEAGLSIDERVAAEWARQEKLIGQFGWTLDDARRSVQAYRAELEQTAQAQRESTFEIRFAAETLGSILDEDMNSLEDLGRVAVKVFRNMAIEWILANQKMAASQSLPDFVGNAFASVFGFGGTASRPTVSGPDPAMAAYPGVFHTGGVIGSTPVSSRWTRSSIFAGAPRMHGGGELRPGERPIIAEDGERMLSRVDNARIVRAIEGGAGAAPRVEVHFHGVTEKPEVRQSQMPDGGLRIDVIARKAVQEAVASGALDKPMKERFGLGRAVRA